MRWGNLIESNVPNYRVNNKYFSGCRDNQTPADALINGKYKGTEGNGREEKFPRFAKEILMLVSC